MRSNLTGETGWSAETLVHMVIANRLSIISKIETELFYTLLWENTLLNVDSTARARFVINLQTELKPLIYNVALLDHKRDPCAWDRYRPPAETHVKASPEPVRSCHPAQAQASQHLVNGRTRAVRSSSHNTVMKRGMNTTRSPTAAKKCKQMRSSVVDAGQSWSGGTANAQQTVKRVLTSLNSFCNSCDIFLYMKMMEI